MSSNEHRIFHFNSEWSDTHGVTSDSVRWKVYNWSRCAPIILVSVSKNEQIKISNSAQIMMSTSKLKFIKHAMHFEDEIIEAIQFQSRIADIDDSDIMQNTKQTNVMRNIWTKCIRWKQWLQGEAVIPISSKMIKNWSRTIISFSSWFFSFCSFHRYHQCQCIDLSLCWLLSHLFGSLHLFLSQNPIQFNNRIDLVIKISLFEAETWVVTNTALKRRSLREYSILLILFFSAILPLLDLAFERCDTKWTECDGMNEEKRTGVAEKIVVKMQLTFSFDYDWEEQTSLCSTSTFQTLFSETEQFKTSWMMIYIQKRRGR